MHIDLTKIKLIIWDLDDTLWNGTLSEGGAQLPVEHSRLIADLTDAGIINSICSKNDLEPTKAELQR
jgi:predicted enzyme involved in methoxymalonyl-ACP biosynthesis